MPNASVLSSSATTTQLHPFPPIREQNVKPSNKDLRINTNRPKDTPRNNMSRFPRLLRDMYRSIKPHKRPSNQNNAQIELHKLVVPAGHPLTLLEEDEVGGVAGRQRGEDGDDDDPEDDVEDAGEKLKPGDDPEEVHVHCAEDDEVGVPSGRITVSALVCVWRQAFWIRGPAIAIVKMLASRRIGGRTDVHDKKRVPALYDIVGMGNRYESVRDVGTGVGHTAEKRDPREPGNPALDPRHESPYVRWREMPGLLHRSQPTVPPMVENHACPVVLSARNGL